MDVLKTLFLLLISSLFVRCNTKNECKKVEVSSKYDYPNHSNPESCFYWNISALPGLKYVLDFCGNCENVTLKQNSRIVVQYSNKTLIEKHILKPGIVELPDFENVSENVTLFLFANTDSSSITFKLILLKKVMESKGVHRKISDRKIRDLRIVVTKNQKLSFTSELFRFGSRVVRVTLEAPLANKLILQFISPPYFFREQQFAEESIFYVFRQSLKLTLYDGKTVSNLILDQDHPMISMNSSSNKVTISFETQGDGVAYIPHNLVFFRLDVYPSSNMHDCFLFDKCKWIHLSDKRVAIKYSNSTNTHLCVSLDVGVDDTLLSFSLETMKDGETKVYDDPAIQFNISGLVGGENVTISGSRIFTPYSIQFAEGFCANIKEDLNCKFNRTTCNWIIHSNSESNYSYVLKESLVLHQGMYIMRTNHMDEDGDKCLELDISGLNGMLTILLVKRFEHVVFRKSYLVDTTFRQKIRFILKNIDWHSRVVLIANGMGNIKPAQIQIFEISELPLEKCKFSNISPAFWNLIDTETTIYNSHENKAIMSIECPYDNCSVNMWTSIDTDFDTPFWGCFAYRFLSSVRTNNLCLELFYETKRPRTEVSIWTQCSPIDNSNLSTVCLPLPNTRGSSVLATISNYDSHNAGIAGRLRKLTDRKDVVTSILLSSPFIRYTFVEASLESGWHQTTTHSMLWSEDKNLGAFVFTPMYNIRYDQMDYLKSPVLTVNINSSFICISFKLRIEKVTFFSLSLEHFPEYHVLKSETVASWKNEFFPTRKAINIRQTFPMKPGVQNYQISFGVSPSPVHAIWKEPGYLYDLSITHSQCEVILNCTFDSDSCGWIKRDTQSNRINYEWFLNPLAPRFDSQFEEKGGYLTLFMIDNQKHRNNIELISELISPPIVSINQNICVEFSYFMNGNDVIGEVKIGVDVDGSGKKRKQVWDRIGSRNGNWYKVQLPIEYGNGGEEFRLKFWVDYEGPEEYFVAIDSIIVRDDSSWECNNLEQILNQTENDQNFNLDDEDIDFELLFLK